MSKLSWQDERTQYEFSRGGDSTTHDVVVFMHALGFDMASWDSMWDRFSGHNSVLRYNQFGHGGRRFQGSESVYDYVQDLLDLLQFLDITNVHIVGHGLGGNIGLLFSILHPNRVRSLTLISTHVVILDSVHEDMLADSETYVSNDRFNKLATLMPPLVCISENSQHVVHESHKKMMPSAYFRYIDGEVVKEYNSIVRKNISLSIPMLHLAGEFDALRPAYIYGITTAMFANSRFLVIQDASHAVQMDRPEEVTRVVQQFISDLTKKSVRIQAKPSRLHREFLHRFINSPLSQEQLKIQLIGEFSLWVNGVRLEGGWNKRKAALLLSYLVFHRTATRDRLCEELWPDIDVQRAHGFLRVSLHHLKHLLESVSPQQTCLQVGRQFVSLTGNIECDIVELMSALKLVNEDPELPWKVDEIERLKHQIFPESLALFDDEQWFWPIRARLESRLLLAVKKLGAYYFDCGQYALAIDAWEYCLNFDEFDLTLYNRIIDSLERVDDDTEARLWMMRKNKMEHALNERRT